MKKFAYLFSPIFVLLILLFMCNKNKKEQENIYAQTKTFVREYTYEAKHGEDEFISRETARGEVYRLLREDIGHFLDPILEKLEKTDEINKLKRNQILLMIPILAGVNIIESTWTGNEYYIKAEIKIDTDEILNKIRAVAIDNLKRSMAETWLQKGADALDRKNYDNAILFHKKGIELAPKSVSAHINMGLSYQGKGNYDMAKEYYQKAIELEPNNAKLYTYLGILYRSIGNDNKAIECYVKAITLDHNQVVAYYNLGGIHYDNKNYDKAIAYIKKAIELNPKNGSAYFMMAMSYGKKGNLKMTIEFFQKAARLGNESAQKWLKDNGYDW